MAFFDFRFGEQGLVVTDFGAGRSAGEGVLVQSDGKILLVGLATDAASSRLAVARYQANGAPDPEFGSSGKIQTVVPGATEISGVSAVLQPDGKILVMATVKTGDTYDLSLVRYNSNGSLDTGFGQVGQITLDLNEDFPIGSSVVVQPNGRIVVVRTSQTTQGLNATYRLVVTGYRSDGLPDFSFGWGGETSVSIPGNSLVGAGIADATVQPDGKILLLSNWYSMLTFSGGQLARLNANGSLDSSFSGGQINLRFGRYDQFFRVRVQPNGQILVGGGTANGILARYNSDGTVDTRFGRNGVSTITQVSSGYTAITGLAIQPDGKLLVKTEKTLLRFDRRGNPDPSFHPTGELPLLNSTDIALTNNGEVIIGGTTSRKGESEFAMVRYVLENVILPGPFSGDAGRNRIRGNAFDNLLAGRGGNDHLSGLAGNDVLLGGKGEDKLVGDLGDDDLQGGAGRDRLVTGLGADRVITGSGRDQILFNANARFNTQQTGIADLVDFDPKQDRILLDRDTFYIRQLNFAVVKDVEQAGLAQANVTYIRKSGDLFFNANGSQPGLGNGGQFANLPDGLALKASAFAIG